MTLTIYVIDDEECIRDSLKWYLEDLGHEVLTASRPVACDVYQGHTCGKEAPCGDALIIDYHMPDMTGLEFIELMTQRGCKGIAANNLLISGNTKDIDQDKATQLGCTVMQKPVPFDHIDEWIEEVKERIKGSTLSD